MTADASAIASRVSATASLISHSKPSTNKASWIGARTETPRSNARQQANRNISAPLAWQGKFRSDLGLASDPIWTVQPNTVWSRFKSMAWDSAPSDHRQKLG